MMTDSLKKRIAATERFEDWYDAFDTCRERKRPIDVCVPEGTGYEYAHIFPSGAAHTFFTVVNNTPADDRDFRENPCDTLSD